VNAADASEPALTVRELRVEYATERGALAAVNGISFTVARGEILGLVGESGCGKTTTAMALLRLVQHPGRIVAGQALLDGGEDLIALDERRLRSVRWQRIALIPQGALNSLNPIMRVKDQLGDVIRTHEHRRVGAAELRQRIERLFSLVGLPPRVYRLYPHELSGGMKQRVCIAMAIALEPPFVIADEPTSALDVIVQRVVAQTLLAVKQRLGMSLLLIGHDMGLMAQMADRVAVMYAGEIVEIGQTREVLGEPLHPYTQILIASVPTMKTRGIRDSGGDESAPDLTNRPAGCIFQGRCPKMMDVCLTVSPELRRTRGNRGVACHLYADTTPVCGGTT